MKVEKNKPFGWLLYLDDKDTAEDAVYYNTMDEVADAWMYAKYNKKLTDPLLIERERFAMLMSQWREE